MKKLALVIIFLIILSSTGCWDKVELDRRTFVLGAAVDTPTNNSDEYMVSVEIPISKIINATVGAGGKDQTKTTLIQSDIGLSIFDIIRNMATQSDKVLYWGHQQELIIGEEIAKEKNINEIIDLWKRDPEVVRSMWVYIAQGKGKSILEAAPKHSTSVSMSINFQMMEQVDKTSELINMSLMEFISLLINNKGDLLVGRIALNDKNEIEIAGSAVIKDYKLKGWLNNNETFIANLIRNKAKDDNFPVFLDGNTIVLEITKAKSKIISKVEDTFIINIDLVCVFGDMTKIVSVDEKYIAKIEQNGKKLIKEQVKSLIKKLQIQYEADVFEFGNLFYKYHPRKWKKIEQDWDILYPNIPVEVNIDFTINHQGLFYEE